MRCAQALECVKDQCQRQCQSTQCSSSSSTAVKAWCGCVAEQQCLCAPGVVLLRQHHGNSNGLALECDQVFETAHVLLPLLSSAAAGAVQARERRLWHSDPSVIQQQQQEGVCLFAAASRRPAWSSVSCSSAADIMKGGLAGKRAAAAVDKLQCGLLRGARRSFTVQGLSCVGTVGRRGVCCCCVCCTSWMQHAVVLYRHTRQPMCCRCHSRTAAMCGSCSFCC